MDWLVLPARCLKCGTIFQTRSLGLPANINIERLHIFGNRESCIRPECDGTALLIEGDFKVAHGIFEILNAPDISLSMLLALRAKVYDAQAGKISIDVLQKEADSISPALGTRLRAILRSPELQGVGAICGILGLVLTLMTSERDEATPRALSTPPSVISGSAEAQTSMTMPQPLSEDEWQQEISDAVQKALKQHKHKSRMFPPIPKNKPAP